jgi:ring-1,2-phenylacetyl-CoA epoxidase subunit PaaD
MMARAGENAQGKHDRQLAGARAALEMVRDPEIPTLTIGDIGILRDVRRDATGRIEAVITPTYSGCPAMGVIESEIRAALDAAGLEDARISTVYSPAWTTDWITERGRRRLLESGIAPPAQSTGNKRALFGEVAVRCPRCDSGDTERVSEFGATACKALYRCRACAEPFEYFKCI